MSLTSLASACAVALQKAKSWEAITFDIWFIPAKLIGVGAMFASIAILFVLPWLDTSPVRSAKFRPYYKMFFWVFVADCILLGYIGMNPPTDILVPIGQIGTAYYFGHFIIVMPLLGFLEQPKPLPDSISAAVTEDGETAHA